MFGAKMSEVPALRENGAATKAPLQFARVVRYVQSALSFHTSSYCFIRCALFGSLFQLRDIAIVFLISCLMVDMLNHINNGLV